CPGDLRTSLGRAGEHARSPPPLVTGCRLAHREATAGGCPVLTAPTRIPTEQLVGQADAGSRPGQDHTDRREAGAESAPDADRTSGVEQLGMAGEILAKVAGTDDLYD